MNGLRAQWLGCSDFLAARGLSATQRPAIGRPHSARPPRRRRNLCSTTRGACTRACRMSRTVRFRRRGRPCSHGPSIRCDIASTFRPRPSWAQDRRFPISQRHRSSAHRNKTPGASGTRARRDPLVHAGGGVFRRHGDLGGPRYFRGRHLLRVLLPWLFSHICDPKAGGPGTGSARRPLPSRWESCHFR